MAGLLCLPPTILDQSFPRDHEELRQASICLGTIQGLAAEGNISVVMTNVFCDIVEDFLWQYESADFALLNEIHRLLSSFVLAQGDIAICLDLSEVPSGEPHPLPAGVQSNPRDLIDVWQDEAGRLLVAHDAVVPKKDGFFIGIACNRAFAGGELQDYPNPVGRCFPLLRTTDIASLIDKDIWEVRREQIATPVPFAEAKRNILKLGAERVVKPRGMGGSHYMCIFSGARSWPLDSNDDPVPEEYLRELVDVTGFPLTVIKYVLLYGDQPPRRFLLSHLLN